MPREAVRCLFFHGIVSGRCLPERKTPTEAERRGETEIKRLLLLLSQCYPLPRRASRRFGNRKSRNTEITQRVRERGRGGREHGSIVEQSITREESHSYYSRQPLCEALQNEYRIDRQSMCDRRQTNAGKNPD